MPSNFYNHPELMITRETIHDTKHRRGSGRVRETFEELVAADPARGMKKPEGLQKVAVDILESHSFEMVIGSVIVLSLICMVIETNEKVGCVAAQRRCSSGWTMFMNVMFTAIFSGECLLRIFGYRWHFFLSRWNCFDIVLVLLSYVDLLASELSTSGNVLRGFRILRLLRVSRILSFFPEIYLMVRGFVGTFKTMFWGMILITGFLFVWSVLTVEVVGPIKDVDYGANTFCNDAFSSVQMCMLFFFQTVFAVDSWGACSTPLIQHSWWTIVIFGGALITMQLGLTNLLLSVIMEKATAAQMLDAERKKEEEAELRRQRIQKLYHVIVDQLDEDGSGSLSMQELEEGLKSHPELTTLLDQLEVRPKDFGEMVALLQDDEGNASIDDIVASVGRCADEDLPRQILLVGLQIFNLRRSVQQSVDMLQERKKEKLERCLNPFPFKIPHDAKKMKMAESSDSKLALHEGDNKERFRRSLEDLETSLSDSWKSLNERVVEQSAMLSQQMEVVLPKISELGSFATAIASTSSAMSAAAAAARFRSAASSAKAAAAATAPVTKKAAPRFLPGAALLTSATKADLGGGDQREEAVGKQSTGNENNAAALGGRPPDLAWIAAAEKMKRTVNGQWKKMAVPMPQVQHQVLYFPEGAPPVAKDTE